MKLNKKNVKKILIGYGNKNHKDRADRMNKYEWCWFQLRHRVDGEVNKMMDIIEEGYEI